MRTSFPLDILSAAQQRALIDLVCSRKLTREGKFWAGRHTHRDQTIEALIGRALAQHDGACGILPTARGIALVGAEAASFNAVTIGGG